MTFLLSVTFVEVLKWIGYVLVALLCLMVMIMIHETGHYLVGKAFHFTILEYSIGFGPKIFQKVNEKTGEKFTLRWIPLGGYCQFKDEDEEATDPGSFNAKPVWQRILVLFAGAFMNFISAIVFVIIFLCAFGDFVPKVYKTYDFVDPAYTQQLEVGDVIYKVDGKNTYSLADPNKLKYLLSGKDDVVLTVDRNGEIMDINVHIAEYQGQLTTDTGEVIDIHGTGIGMSASYLQQKVSFFKAIPRAFQFAYEEVALIFRTFGSIFRGAAKVSENMGGTVTAITVLSQLAENGFQAVFYGLCVLSVSIGVMNLLPFPALDGCRIVFCIVEWIRRKPNNRKIEAIINFAGLIVLILLAVTLDLLHFLG